MQAKNKRERERYVLVFYLCIVHNEIYVLVFYLFIVHTLILE